MPTIATYAMQQCTNCQGLISIDDAECNHCNAYQTSAIIKQKLKPKQHTIATDEYQISVSELINRKYRK